MKMSSFKCKKCNCEPEMLNSFGVFGNNPLKIDDRGEYCDACFEQVAEKYELKYPERKNELTETYGIIE
jgi:hypothetical protein